MNKKNRENLTAKKPVNNYWFVLGSHPLLSAAEIFLLLGNSKGEFLERDVLLINSLDKDPGELMRQLGGTIKIGRELGQKLTPAELKAAILAELNIIDGKINFGLSFYGATRSPVQNLGKEIKQTLKTSGRSLRYIFKREAILSSATVEANKLVHKGREFLVDKNRGKFRLAKTVALQPFKDWSKRDYERPGADSKSGMLPPKLARMMINLGGLGEDTRSKTLWDPFCGSGTILNEALLAGFKQVVGSDISAKAVADSKKNLAWLQANFNGEFGDVKVFESDVKEIKKEVSAKSIDLIVTEPFLGPPLRGNESISRLQVIAKELKNLYLAAFTTFKQVVKPSSQVIFVVPRFKGRGQLIRVSQQLLPLLNNLGFNPQPLLPPGIYKTPYLLYARSGQKVEREIWKFGLK